MKYKMQITPDIHILKYKRDEVGLYAMARKSDFDIFLLTDNLLNSNRIVGVIEKEMKNGWVKIRVHGKFPIGKPLRVALRKINKSE